MKNTLKKVMALLMAAALAVCLAACDDGDINEYLEDNGIDPSQIEQYTSDADIVPDAPGEVDIQVGGDALPETLISSWNVVGIYQYAVASDITEQEALDRERANGVAFGYNYFSRSGEEITGAVFTVNKAATYADMNALGIQTESLVDTYGADASITSVGIATADGSQCTTVFLINDTTLVAFGSGMNVFTYESMEAVG